MLKGTINCPCGQYLYFETASDTVECPACKVIYDSKEHAELEFEEAEIMEVE